MTPTSTTLRPATRLRLLASAIGLALGACATPPVVNWPAELAPSANEAWLMTVAARGVQLYECRANTSGAAWAFVAPEAELFDDARRKVGTHGAGPFWQHNDGSRVLGTMKARADAPMADAIPWLLLETRSDGPAGAISGVKNIRRVHTVGGLAPREGCSPGTLGTTVRVPYAADYFLYTTR